MSSRMIYLSFIDLGLTVYDDYENLVSPPVATIYLEFNA